MNRIKILKLLGLSGIILFVGNNLFTRAIKPYQQSRECDKSCLKSFWHPYGAMGMQFTDLMNLRDSVAKISPTASDNLAQNNEVLRLNADGEPEEYDLNYIFSLINCEGLNDVISFEKVKNNIANYFEHRDSFITAWCKLEDSDNESIAKLSIAKYMLRDILLRNNRSQMVDKCFGIIDRNKNKSSFTISVKDDSSRNNVGKKTAELLVTIDNLSEDDQEIMEEIADSCDLAYDSDIRPNVFVFDF